MPSVDGWDIAKGAWGVLVTVLGYLGVRARSDIDALQRDAVNKAEHEKTIDRLEMNMREHRQETREGFAQVFERLNNIADRLTK